MKTFFGVLFGILFAALLLVGGCTVMVGGCTKAVVDAETNRQKAQFSTNQQVVGSSPSPQNKENSPSVSLAAPSPPRQEWADANQAVRQGDVQVRVAKVAIDFVQIKDFGSSQSKDKLFIVSLAITNLSPTKIVDYKGWGARELDFSGEDRAGMKDDTDNSYKRVHFGLGSRIEGQVFGNESIYPNKTLNDIVIFEPPTDAAKFVLLELPASGFGGNGMLRIKIPRAMWDENMIAAAEAARLKEEHERAETQRQKEAEERRISEEKKKQAAEQARWHTWTSADGKFSVKAKFIRGVGNTIYLEKENGSEIKVNKEQLCEEDKKWIDHKSWNSSSE